MSVDVANSQRPTSCDRGLTTSGRRRRVLNSGILIPISQFRCPNCYAETIFEIEPGTHRQTRI
jgi:hypothetical protein